MSLTFQAFCQRQKLAADLLSDPSFKLNISVDRTSLSAGKDCLPEDRLELAGGLQIFSNVDIRLPEVIKVGGDLILVGRGIKSLPRKLEVGGKLEMRETAVEEIHSGCSVGHLKVGETPLRFLPDDWVVPGDIHFMRCGFLVLPNGLSAGSLRLVGCKVSELPARLSVRDELYISGSFISEIPADCRCGVLTAEDSGLVKLPDNWSVEGGLYLSGVAIRVLPKGLHASFLDISETRIEEIPSDCEVGALKAKCSCMTRLPENWTVNGNLNLSGCKFLKELPKGLCVRGTLYICETNIKEIPSGCRVGSLDATKSTLERLPDNWVVEGDVDLFGCERMKELPHSLQVGGYLTIMRTNITRIPSDTKFRSLCANETPLNDLGGHNKVEGHLMLRGTGFKSLPERLEVGGDLQLDNLKIGKLPDYLRVGGSMSCEFAQVDSFSKDGVVAGSVACRGCHPRLVPAGFIAADTTYLKAKENRMFEFTSSGLEFHPNGQYCRYKGEVWRVVERDEKGVRIKRLLTDEEWYLKKDKGGRYRLLN